MNRSRLTENLAREDYFIDEILGENRFGFKKPESDLRFEDGGFSFRGVTYKKL